MSISLEKFSISTPLNFFAKQAFCVADKLTEFTFHVLDGATTSLGRLLPDLRPTSVGDAVLQVKKTESAFFETSEGDVLIEITQDKKGYYIFKAVGETLEPIVIYEGRKKTSGAAWEVKVSTYLQQVVKSADSVSYGETARRWKGESFATLKEKFAADGLLRKRGDEVLLKLPGEDLLTFDGAQASLKAEIVLKHFYQRRKTQVEEVQSRPWELLNNLFVGYLYFSGYALAPWVNDHVMLPHQRAQVEDEKARYMTADGFLDNHELTEMAKHPGLRDRVISIAEAQADAGEGQLFSQLENVTFQPDGYFQTFEYGGKSYDEQHVFSGDSETHSLKVCPDSGLCEEFITEQTPTNLIYMQKRHGTDKIEVQKATFTKEGAEWKLVHQETYEEGRVLRLSDRSFASTILDQSQQLVAHAAKAYLASLITQQSPKMVVIASLFHLVSRTDALANSKPLSEIHQIKEIKSDAVRSSMRRTAPITLLNPLPNLSVEPGNQLSYNINLQSQFQLSNPNQNLELSIRQANGQPAPSWISLSLGAITLDTTFYLGSQGISSVCVAGNYAYTLVSSTGLDIVDISNPGKPVVVGVISSATPLSIVVKGNYAYLANSTQLQVINIATPSSPTLVTTLNIPEILGMFVVGNYLYAGVYGVSLKVINISNPLNPTQIGSLTMSSNAMASGVYVLGNHAFIASSDKGCYIINVSTPSSPVLITTITPIPWGFDSVVAKGNYLYLSDGSNVYIYDITTISTPVLVKTISVFNNPVFLTLEGNYIYVSTSSNINSFNIIDITNVLNAQIIASISSPGTLYNTFLSNNNIFLANGGAGLTIYNAGSRVLSGTPSVSDRGLLHLNVTAQDDLGNTLVNSITIHVGDINVAIPISNQKVYVGNSTMLTLPAGTFEYPNANFVYSAELVGGLPLPSCINFDPSTLTFLFTPHSGDQNTYRIQVNGNDGYGGSVSTTFDLVVPDRIPVLAQPFGNQTAYTGVPFEYTVANNSFTDADNDHLVYSANLVGATALPSWLSFDPALRRFYGTPFGRNTYQIQMNANDQKGGVTSGTFMITVPSSAPILLNPVGTQLASIGIPFSFTFASNTFYDLDGDPLTYSTNTLPSFLSFNNVTKTFTGTPQTQDAGTYSITINAENLFGAVTSATFSLSVVSFSNVIPPVLVRAIPDFSITSGIPFNTIFNAATFEDPQGQNLTCTATLEGGSPLPAGLYFNANTLTLSGTVAVPQIMRITIKATDPYGAFAIDTFTLTVLDGTKYPPIVLNPLTDRTATVGAPFAMTVPKNTFQDLNGDQLTITVSQAGGQPLPDWLKWDAATLSLSGTPGPFDTNTYSTRQVTINVWAKDGVGNVKTSFILSVGGESFWATFIKYGFSFGSVAITALGVWKERALIWNYLCREKYQKDPQTALVGQHYSHRLKLAQADVKEIKILFNGQVLPVQKPFPDGLIYKDDQLCGTPSGKMKGRFTVRVIDHVGYINEEFELIIKNEGEADPEVETQLSHMAAAKMQLSQLRQRFLTKGDEDQTEQGQTCLGRVEKHLPTEFAMRTFRKNGDSDTKI